MKKTLAALASITAVMTLNACSTAPATPAPTSSVPTLTKMGEVTSDLAAFVNLPDNVDLRIELQQ